MIACGDHLNAQTLFHSLCLHVWDRRWRRSVYCSLRIDVIVCHVSFRGGNCPIMSDHILNDPLDHRAVVLYLRWTFLYTATLL